MWKCCLTPYLNRVPFFNQRLYQFPHLIRRKLLKPFGRCLPVKGIDHHFSRFKFSYYIHPSFKDFRRGRVKEWGSEEHCLKNKFPAKPHQIRNNILDMIFPLRLIDPARKFIGRSVNLENRIVHLPQSLEDILSEYPCGVRQNRHFRLREILVSQRDGNVNNFSEIRIQSRLSISGKRYGVNRSTRTAAFLQFRLQSLMKLSGGRKLTVSPAILVPATLAINAIEIAQFSFRRKQIDSERRAQPSGVYRPEHKFLSHHG